MARSSLLCCIILSILVPRPAAADEPRTLHFALIVGVNRSVDRDAPDLSFADDDAARYYDLFDALGIQSSLLARMDENTSRLHARAARRARPPNGAQLERSVARLAARVAEAKKRGLQTVLYFVYAGHGNVADGRGYLSLEDARLTGADIEARVLDKVRPWRAHLIVDACYSYYLASARGPGGQRRPVNGFSHFQGLDARPEVGMLLSTSSARTSHEWARVQGGVFSHEVRSGLYGAADADRDGQVTYREIAAFVERANAAIPNERFRPEVFARPPAGETRLLDLRRGLKRRIEVDGATMTHYLLEDEFGVSLVEFHNAPGQGVHLVRPRSGRRLYLRRQRDQQEFVIDATPDVVRTADLRLTAPHHQTRGALHDAFERTFELPFGARQVAAFRFPRAPVEEPWADGPRWQTSVGVGLLGLSAAGSVVGGWALYTAHDTRADASGASQAAAAESNEQIRKANITAGVAFSVAGVAAGSGLLLLLWPETPVRLELESAGARVGIHAPF